MTYGVWAPLLERVRVQVDGDVHEMSRDTAGWWQTDVPERAGARYAYLLGDDEQPLPDPRSRRQPDGVHEASEVYDHDAFAWTDDGWTGRQLAGSVLYEMHVGTFTTGGTFDSAVERLDHLVDLGVDLVEVLPVNSFDGPRGWGYDGVLWGAVHEPYGGPDGFKRFVDACHARGLGVVLDVVYNHLGPSGAYLDRFGPYFAGQNDWGPGLNLDGEHSDEVRRYVVDNALSWLRDFHVDGLRLDAVHALVDQRAVHVLEQLAEEVEALSAGLGRPLSLVAESDRNDPRTVTSRERGGLGMDAQWADDVHHALHVRLTGETSGYYGDFAAHGALATTLRQAFFHAGTYSTFRGRTHGRPVDVTTVPGARFVVYTQTHDQVGNRATGDRLAATLSPGLLGCAAAVVLLGPYTPMLFMGEEWAASTPWQFFASFPDPELGEAVRTGRRREFGRHGWDEHDVPDPMDVATFERSTLRWDEREQGVHADVLGVYRALLALRRAHPELADPSLTRFAVETADDDSWLVLQRGDLRVAVCFGPGAVVPLDAVVDGVLLAPDGAEPGDGGVRLGAESFAVVRVRR
ncbi:malto-oligosyltrehalose trehalohydrolase [Aeromicrobium sp. IC_218]|uniref:malto-oligosyltrehalose trehalohydrolase n=1 Tax=Aeromicrobium sp. IC_218 TaxID=2545468 RepID=UPI00103B6CDC|nr:malto-oligosyltrehalose trehalohydrolase [Aeromicrobium sp. IC_218]TCI99055.1 malto-oligosyltrehalose trehalohydrolase [Aeromicrobium sp. IC_218]